jgi:hypothetical protein
MHLAHPTAQAVEDQPPNNRFVGVQSVAAAGVVGVTGFVFLQNVLGLVCKTAEAEGGPIFVAFGGVVVNDIEDDLDSGAVQRLDHVTKLVEHTERVPSRTVSIMRREKRKRLIPPIIAEARRTILFVEGEDRQKLDRADAKVPEVGNLLDQPSVSAALDGATPELGCRVKPPTCIS